MATVRPSPITILTTVAFVAFVFSLQVSAAQTPSTSSGTDNPAADASALTLPTSAVKVNFIEATLLNTNVPESGDPITVRLVPLTSNNTASSPSNGAEKKNEIDSVSSVIADGLPRHHEEEGFSKYSMKRSYIFLEEKVKKHLNPEDKDDDRDDDDNDDDTDDDDDNDDHDSDDDRDDGDGDDEEEKKKEKKKLGRKFGP